MPLGAAKTGLMGAAGTAGAGARGVWGGGEGTDPAANTTNVCDYITINTTGNATDFGDWNYKVSEKGGDSNGSNDRGVMAAGYTYNGSWSTTDAIGYFTISAGAMSVSDFGNCEAVASSLACTSNKADERMVMMGGQRAGSPATRVNIIQYITVNSAGDSTDFGDLNEKVRSGGCDSNGTDDRAVYGGGYTTIPSPLNLNVIDYFTITSTGDATDFGDLINCQGGQPVGSVSNLTNDRVCFSNGNRQTSSPCSGAKNQISYITITSTGDSTDFGDLTSNVGGSLGTSDGTDERGVWAGSGGADQNVIEYITINSTGNSTDFGDLSRGRQNAPGVSNVG